MGLPSINNESRFLVRYSKLFGIFLLKLAAEVESNMIRATFSGIPPGFVGRSRTSFLGNTCICTSDFVSPEDVSTSTRMKSWSTDAIPVKTSTRKNKMKMLAPASRSQSGRSIRRNAMFPISFPEPTCLSVSAKTQSSGNEPVGYSRVPCLGADQKTLGLWKRDCNTSTLTVVRRNLKLSIHIFSIKLPSPGPLDF